MSDSHTAAKIKASRPTPYPLRDDTMLGVCAALGELFGFKPLYLRIGISLLVILNLKLSIIVYLGLGLAVAIGHLIFPRRASADAAPGLENTAPEANDPAPVTESIAA